MNSPPSLLARRAAFTNDPLPETPLLPDQRRGPQHRSLDELIVDLDEGNDVSIDSDRSAIRERNRSEIRVLVVDDHDPFRTGLASWLGAQPEIEVVGQASGGRMGVRLAGEVRPDVVLMDLQMPDLDGSDATRAILEHDPSTRVLILTVSFADDDVKRAIEAGACGFLVKDTPIDGVIAAIHAAAGGAARLSPRAAEIVLSGARARAHPQRPEGGLERLSPRELDVLRLVAAGMENSEIVSALNISPRTAKNHVANILDKLDLPSRVQAAVYAVRQGLV